MTDFIASFGFSSLQWLLIIVSVSLIGMNKTGLVGVSLISIPILASVFGGRASTGVLVPLLVCADIVAVISFRKAIRWKVLLGLMPWALAGIAAAIIVGGMISDRYFKICIASVILLVLVLMTVKEIRGSTAAVPAKWYVDAVIGLLGGFSTMIGNAAGPIIVVYFLSRNMARDEFVATRAWFFWILNVVKIPLHFFFWQTISARTLGFDLLLVPAAVAGGLIGLAVVKRIPEKPYRIFLIAVTAASTLFLVLS